jgi:hypothetical protein
LGLCSEVLLGLETEPSYLFLSLPMSLQNPLLINDDD